MKKIVFFSDIDFANSPQPRAEIRRDVVEEYAAQYRLNKQAMPPPDLFQAGKVYLIADGMHRISAMQLAKLKGAMFEVHTGNKGKSNFEDRTYGSAES